METGYAYNLYGCNLDDLNKSDSTLEYYTKYKEIAEKNYGKESLAVSTALGNIGSIYHN
jgi:hypothetical protein